MLVGKRTVRLFKAIPGPGNLRVMLLLILPQLPLTCDELSQQAIHGQRQISGKNPRLLNGGVIEQ